MFSNFMRPENNLFDEVHRLQRDTDTLFGSGLGRANIRAVATGSFPLVNVGSTPDAAYVYVFAPGLDGDTLDVSMQRNVLTIAGSRSVAEKPAAGRAGYHLQERPDGTFRRAVALSDDVDPEQVDATYNNGLLRIKVGKREAAKPRRISVKNT